jgi:hypothetical protein
VNTFRRVDGVLDVLQALALAAGSDVVHDHRALTDHHVAQV